MSADLTEMLDTIRNLMDKKAALIDAYDGRIKMLTDMLGSKMREEGLEKLRFAGATAYFREEIKAEVKDWNKVMQFVKQNDAFDILQRRVAPAQLRKRIEVGANIEGVVISKAKTLTIRRCENETASD